MKKNIIKENNQLKTEEIQSLINRLKVEGLTTELIPLVEEYGVEVYTKDGRYMRSTYNVVVDLAEEYRMAERAEQILTNSAL